jgi:hypothetical protein
MMTAWNEITREQYWDALECLPPAIMTGLGFLIGEPHDHRKDTGAPEFAAYVEYKGMFFAAEQCLTIKEFKALDSAPFEIVHANAVPPIASNVAFDGRKS